MVYRHTGGPKARGPDNPTSAVVAAYRPVDTFKPKRTSEHVISEW